MLLLGLAVAMLAGIAPLLSIYGQHIFVLVALDRKATSFAPRLARSASDGHPQCQPTSKNAPVKGGVRRGG